MRHSPKAQAWALIWRDAKLSWQMGERVTFQIADLPVPGGGTLGLCPLPGRWGDVLGNFEMIRKWAPSIVVSMTELAEMERHNVADMGGILASDGIAWAHFPVRDFGVPESEAEWAGLSQKLRTILDSNGKVLVHCYGGKGRSGMVLTRLLVERGDLARIALQKIRNVRKGAVETGEQEIWGASGFLING